jgi:hypothetical protein
VVTGTCDENIRSPRPAIRSGGPVWRNKSALDGGVGHPAKNQNRSHRKNCQRHNRNLGGGEGRDQRRRRPDWAKIRLGRRLFAGRPKKVSRSMVRTEGPKVRIHLPPASTADPAASTSHQQRLCRSELRVLDNAEPANGISNCQPRLQWHRPQGSGRHIEIAAHRQAGEAHIDSVDVS